MLLQYVVELTGARNWAIVPVMPLPKISIALLCVQEGRNETVMLWKTLISGKDSSGALRWREDGGSAPLRCHCSEGAELRGRGVGW